jgi:hypothetical protein
MADEAEDLAVQKREEELSKADDGDDMEVDDYGAGINANADPNDEKYMDEVEGAARAPTFTTGF